ncbi:serine protease 7-like [Episyrphus balteatus]|uniref:serine protease 7-like n=1 Tax=Episyrphus balteatus TaxID=286459 RepID=UPI002485D7D7|nr:serine protease 7-like [Episyrphus balteatus]
MFSKYTSNLMIGVLVACLLVQFSRAENSCTTPYNKNGTCISIRDCAPLLSLISKTPLSDADKQFAKQSQCENGIGSLPHVCCPTEEPSVNNGEGNILPSVPQCGKVSPGNRILNGIHPSLDEFPWLALLEHSDIQNDNRSVFYCVGSLINSRYVLTAAHCITGAILQRVGPLNRVRLGEYDLSVEIDCEGGICADTFVNMKIEATIPHPQYNESNRNRENDIGLIRLDEVVTYTKYIKPICLPSALGQPSSLTTGTNLIVSGWGDTTISRESYIKQKVFIPIIDFQECSEKYATRRIQLASSQLCAGDQSFRGSCVGDSGEPLMSGGGKINYAIEGVNSFNRCGIDEWPGVYTKVSDFESWIRSTIRP